MKKNKRIKLIVLIILGMIVLKTCFVSETKAIELINNKQQKIDLHEVIKEEDTLISKDANKDTKIMEYDRETGETKEVNMEELKQNLIVNYGLQDAQTEKTEGYDPYKKTKLKPLNYRASNYEKVPDVSQFPFRTICYITLKNSAGQTGNGSGFLVGRKLLLTSAHCVFDRDNNDELLNWTATVGVNGDSNYGSSRVG